MADIKIDWDVDAGDFLFADNDLTTDKGLQTAVIVSLFTDRRAYPDDVLPDSNSKDRRGWWGDSLSPLQDDRIGSRLWLLNREKTTTLTLERVRRYAKEALNWMVEDGVAASVQVEVERQGTVGNDVLAWRVQIRKQDGAVEAVLFNTQWEETFNAV